MGIPVFGISAVSGEGVNDLLYYLYDVIRKTDRTPKIFEKEFEIEYVGDRSLPYTVEKDEEGIYVDITTGEPLFFAKDKFASGCGWPSFSRPIAKDVVHYYRDHSHGMERIEVRSRSGNAHLGHVLHRWTKRPRWPTLLQSIRPHCALFQKRKWSKKVMD